MAIINLWNDRQSIARDVAIETSTSTQNGVYTGWDTTVERCDLRLANASGIYADGSELSVIRNNIIVGCDIGIEYGSSAYQEKVHDNHIYHLDDNTIHDGMYIRGTSHHVHDNYLTNCRMHIVDIEDTTIEGNYLDGWGKTEYADGLIWWLQQTSTRGNAIRDNTLMNAYGIGIYFGVDGTHERLNIDGNHIDGAGLDYGIYVEALETLNDFNLRQASISGNTFRDGGNTHAIYIDLTGPTSNVVWDQLNIDDNIGTGCRGIRIDTGVGHMRALSVCDNRLGGDINIGTVYTGTVSRNNLYQELSRDGGRIEVLDGNSVVISENHVVMPSWIDSYWVSQGWTAVVTIPEGRNNVISDNHIAGRYVPGIAAIEIGGIDATVTGNVYTGRLYDGSWETDDLTVGIRILDRAQRIRLDDNDMRKIDGPAVVDNSVRGIGLEVLEAHGQAAFPGNATTVTIDHGLSVEALTVLVTPMGNEDLWISHADEMTFTVSRVSGDEPLRFSWYAASEESAAGPPIEQVGVTDEVTFTLTVARTITDGVGVTDTVGTVEA